MDASLEKQNKLTAGENITISGNTISATDTTYTAGDNVKIDENNVISVPTATSEVAGVVKPYSVLNSAPSVNGATDEEGRYYPVQTDSTNKLVVNVPWYANEGGGSSSGIEEITASGTAPLTLTATQTNSRVNISGSVDLSDYLTSAVADKTYQEKLKYYKEREKSNGCIDIEIGGSGDEVEEIEIYGNEVGLIAQQEAYIEVEGGGVVQVDENRIIISNDGVHLIVQDGIAKYCKNNTYDGPEIATIDDLDNYQDKLQYYTEDNNIAEITAENIVFSRDESNFVRLTSKAFIANVENGISLTGNDIHLITPETEYMGKAYYNDKEIATVDDLSDYLTSAVADETYQEKLKYYSESDLNVYINLNSSGNFSMSTPSNTLRFDLLGSSGILLQTNFQGGNINFNTLASSSGVYYNGSEVATVDDLSDYNTSSTWFANVFITAHEYIDRSNIYPSTGTVKVGDCIFSIGTSTSSTEFQLVIASVESVSDNTIRANPIVSISE